MKEFDVVLVGAGMVGASIAGFLAPHRRVLLVEAEQAAGYHATGRSAALFAASYGPAGIRALSRASRAFFEQPPAEFASAPLLHPRNVLFVGRADQREEVKRLYAEQTAEGNSPQLLDSAAARSLVPVLTEEAVDLALLEESAFDIDVDLLLQGFLKTARGHGASVLLNDRLVGLSAEQGGWRIDTASGSQFRAPQVVNCAGAWVDEVAALAGVPSIGIEPRRRSAFLFEPPQGMDCSSWPAVIAIDESWYFKPDAGLLLGSPANADPVPAHDVVTEELDIATGIYRIEEVSTLRIRRPRHTWAGLRSFVDDGEPVCGFDASAPGFFWAAALGGYGIQTAPAFGRLCAQLLLGQGVPTDIADQGLCLDDIGAHRATLSRTAP